MRFEDFRDQLHARCRRTDRGLVVFRKVVSSHAAAQHVVREYRSEGSTPPTSDLVAWAQSEGQGRDGRSWSSPAGAGAYVSLIRPDLDVDLQTLPLRIAVALCEEINRSLDDRCRVRWPNDLLVGPKKIAGILLDLHTQGDEPSVAVISFGVNHAEDPSVFDEARATTVLAEGGDLALVELVARLVSAVDAALDEPPTFDAVRSAYESLSSHAHGDALTVRGTGGTGAIEGVFRGFDAKGFLRLEVDGEERLLASGLLAPVANE